MIASFVIIHPSSIFSQGLKCILQKISPFQIYCFKNSQEFKDHSRQLKGIPQLIFADNSFSEILVPFMIKHANKYTKLIFVGEQEVKGYPWLSNQTSEDQLKEIVRNWKNSISSSESRQKKKLTQRELDVLRLLVLGYATKEIAKSLFISEHTVISHRKNITKKLGIKSLSGLTVYAIINSLIDTTSLNVDDLI